MLPVMARTHGLVGQSPPINIIRRLIDKASLNRLPVLLLGETGTGKEVVARAIYNSNPRGQFVPIDCGSLVGSLMQSELFGHVKGSFSGASENKKGLVEMADGGTAFFDEIGDLPFEMQVKLLRLLQEREFRAVGSLHWRKVDLRIIAATHRDLKAEVAAGRFRQDLYYRLNVFSIRLPPLRERKQDIPDLVEHFLEACREAGLPWFNPGKEVMEVLSSYSWPGNVRELKHCIDRMAAMYSSSDQDPELPSPLRRHRFDLGLELPPEDPEPAAADDWLDPCYLPGKAPVVSLPQSEKLAIQRALRVTNGERGKAAEILAIGRTTLYRKMKEYQIN